MTRNKPRSAAERAMAKMRKHLDLGGKARRWALVCALGAFWATAAQASTISGFVTEVYTGDTFELGGKVVQLIGVEAPRGDHPYAATSRRALGALIGDALVRVKVRDLDKHNRYLADVFLHGMNVNNYMLRQGHVFLDIVDEPDNYKKALVHHAKHDGRGLWAESKDEDEGAPSDERPTNGAAKGEDRHAEAAGSASSGAAPGNRRAGSAKAPAKTRAVRGPEPGSKARPSPEASANREAAPRPPTRANAAPGRTRMRATLKRSVQSPRQRGRASPAIERRSAADGSANAAQMHSALGDSVTGSDAEAGSPSEHGTPEVSVNAEPSEPSTESAANETSAPAERKSAPAGPRGSRPSARGPTLPPAQDSDSDQAAAQAGSQKTASNDSASPNESAGEAAPREAKAQAPKTPPEASTDAGESSGQVDAPAEPANQELPCYRHPAQIAGC